MEIYSGGQLLTRFVAMAIGALSGLAEVTWVYAINSCGTRSVGGVTVVYECAEWTRIFLEYPAEWVSLLSSVLTIGGILGITAAILALWKPTASTVVFFVVAAINLAAILPAWLDEQAPPAAIYSSLAVILPLAMGASLLKWGK